MSKSTDLSEFFSDLEAGVFEQKIARAVSEVASGVIEHSRKGKLTITLDFRRVGNGSQVGIIHKLTYQKPTLRGKLTEDNVSETTMHVSPKGDVTLFPINQGQMFTREGGVQQPTVKE